MCFNTFRTGKAFIFDLNAGMNVPVNSNGIKDARLFVNVFWWAESSERQLSHFLRLTSHLSRCETSVKIAKARTCFILYGDVHEV